MGVRRCCLVALQRLLESTFRLDIAAAREYCEADDRWSRATAFLAANGAAGWSLIEVRSPSVLEIRARSLQPGLRSQDALSCGDAEWMICDKVEDNQRHSLNCNCLLYCDL